MSVHNMEEKCASCGTENPQMHHALVGPSPKWWEEQRAKLAHKSLSAMTEKNVVGETMERAVMIATCRGLAQVCRLLAEKAKDSDTGNHFASLGSSFDSMGRIQLGALWKEMEFKPKHKRKESKPLDAEVLNILKEGTKEEVK